MAAESELRRPFFLLGTLLAAGAILYWAKPVAITLTIAVLATFILAPIVSRLEGAGLPRIIACILTLVFATMIMAVIVNGFVQQMSSLADEFPAYKEGISAKYRELQEATADSWVGNIAKFAKESDNDAKAKTPAEEGESKAIHAKIDIPVLAVVQSAAGTAADILITGVIVIVLAFLLLMRREDLRNRLIHLLGSDNRISATRALDDASKRVSRFLFSQLAINVGFGIVVAIGLYFIGIPFPYVWGALAALLRYVPFVGGWIAAGFPLLASLVMPTWTPFLLTGIFFIIIEVVQSYIVEPLVFGHSIGVSAPGQVIAMVFWGSLWGPVGLILSTPLTACLCVLGLHFPGLRFVATMLGDGEIVARRDAFYQRLLAGDMVEAGTLAETFLKENSLAALIDEVFVPALLAARYDRRRGELSAEDLTGIVDAVREIYIDLISNTEASVAESPVAPVDEEKLQVLVVDFPFNDSIDHLVIAMVKSTADPAHETWSTVTIGDTSLTEANQDFDLRPDLVVVSTTATQNLGRIRGACRTVHKLFPDGKAVACCWGLDSETETELARLRGAGAEAVCTTVAQARELLKKDEAPATPLVTS